MIKTTIRLLCILLVLCAKLATAQPGSFAPPANGLAYSPRETLQVTFDDNLSPRDLSALVIELDRIDVTALAVIQPNGVAYRPVENLKPGTHRLRIALYKIDGAVTELGLWAFEVDANKSIQAASLVGRLDVSVRQQVDTHDRPEDDDIQLRALGQYQGTVTTKNWGWQSQWQVAYDNDISRSLTGKKADIPTFVVEGQHQHFGLTLGDHSVAPANLVQDNTFRRGISGHVKASTLNTQLTAYSQTANQTIGLGEKLGQTNDSNKLSGFHLETFPLNTENHLIMLAAQYVSGKTQNSAYGSTDFFAPTTNPVHEGSASNTIIDAQLFEKKWRLRFEHAQTEYDFDGIGIGYDADTDEAWQALGAYESPYSDSQLIKSWTIGLEAEEIGTYYRSIQNPFLPNDRKRERLFAKAQSKQWFWDINIGRENNNLIDDDNFALTETMQWQFTTGFQTDYAQTKNPVFGHANYALSVNQTKIRDDYTPLAFIANDMETSTVALQAAFDLTTWQWQMGSSFVELKDLSGYQPNTQTSELNLGFQKPILSTWHLQFQWQGQHIDYQDLSGSGSRQLFTVSSQSELIPERLQANIDLSFNRNDATEDPYFALRDRSTYINANIDWIVKAPKNNRLGFSMALNILMDDYFDHLQAFNDSRGYQVYLEFKSVLPSNFATGSI